MLLKNIYYFLIFFLINKTVSLRADFIKNLETLDRDKPRATSTDPAETKEKESTDNSSLKKSVLKKEEQKKVPKETPEGTQKDTKKDAKKAAKNEETRNSKNKIFTKTKDPITFKGGSSTVDFSSKDRLIILKKEIQVNQGPLSIRANEAKIYTKDDEVQKVEASGHVILTRLKDESGETVEATCDKLYYLAEKKIIQLVGNATLVKGSSKKIQGKTILYHMTSQQVEIEKAEGYLEPNKEPDKEPTKY